MADPNRHVNQSTSSKTATSTNDRTVFTLRSPFADHGGISYGWPLTDDERAEIAETVRIFRTENKEMYFVLEQKFKRNGVPSDWTDRASIDEFFRTFNSLADSFRSLWKGTNRPIDRDAKNGDYLKQILTNLAYRRAIPDPNVLNKHYSAFSSQTYGETTFNRLASIVNELHISENDVMVDLGSGVGNVILQMAAASRVKKCVGIEIAQTPAHAAQRLSEEFCRWMEWFGKKWQPFELINDDFLDRKYHELITNEATILFINNYAFSADLECKIKHILCDLTDGTRVISTRPYASINSNVRITKRRLESAGADLTAMFDVVELPHVPQSTSWTCNTVTYYLHTVNSAKMERYFETANRSNGNGSNSPSDAGSPASHKFSGTSRCSSVQPSALLQRAIVQSRLEDHQAMAMHARREKKHKKERVVKKEKRHDHASDVAHGHSSSPPSVSSKSTSRESSVSRANQKAIKAAQAGEGGGAVDGSFYGPTTRRQWNAWVENKTFGGPSTKGRKDEKRAKKVHKDTSVTTDEQGSTDGREEVDPVSYGDSASRKRRSSEMIGERAPKLKGKIGRPPKEVERKPVKLKHARHDSLDTALSGKTSAKVADALQQMHDMTRLSNRCTSPGVHVSSLRASSIEGDTKPMTAITAVDKQAAEMLTPGLLPQHGENNEMDAQLKHFNQNPVLNGMMGRVLRMYSAMIERYSSDSYKEELELEIKTARARHATLETNKQRLVEQIDRLLHEGCGKLTDRLSELNIVARAPLDLMAQSKEIVLQHQELKNRLLEVAGGVAEATQRNQQLLDLLKDRDDQCINSGALRSIGVHNVETVEGGKQAILAQVDHEFRIRRTASEEHRRVAKEMATLQATLSSLPSSLVVAASNEVAAAGGTTLPDMSTAPIAKRSRAPRGGKREGGVPRKREKKESTNLPATQPIIQPIFTPVASAPPTVVEKIAEPIVEKIEVGDSDDIDQQVQSFVSVALKVDERAKREEKERRQRSDQRRNRKPTTSATPTPSTPIDQPTFISSGLVPVYADQPKVDLLVAPVDSDQRQRARSGESTETESAPTTPPNEGGDDVKSNDGEELTIDDEGSDARPDVQASSTTPIGQPSSHPPQ